MQIARQVLFLCVLLFFMGISCLNAQRSDKPLNCYEKLLREGDQELDKGHYDKAIRQYWAAFDCELPEDHQLVERIQKVSERWVAELEHQAEEARQAEKEARAAEQEAIEAKDKEAKARALAQQKAEEARRRGKQVEAMRLSLLSDKARASGQSGTAIALAYLSLKMWPDDSLSSKMRAFSTAIRDSFERVYIQPDEAIKTLLPVQQEGLLFVSEEKAYFYSNKMKAPQVLPQAFTRARNIAMAPDGQAALLFFEENEVAFWERVKSDQLSKWDAHDGRVIGGEFYGNTALTYSSDRTARLWTQPKDQAVVLSGHEGTVYAASFSPSGEYVMTRASDGSVRIWDLEGACKSIIRDEKGYIYKTQFSGDSQTLLTAGASGKATLWSLDGEAIRKLNHGEEPVIDAAFIQDGKWVLSRSPRTAKVWNSKTGALIYESDLGLEGVKWVPERQALLMWYYSGEIQVRQLGRQETKRLSGHNGPIVKVLFSPNGKQLLSTSQDGTARLWDHHGNTLITWNLQSQTPLPAFFSTDSRLIYTVQEDNRVINSCVNPTVALQQMEQQEAAWQSEFSGIQDRYQLIFWE